VPQLVIHVDVQNGSHSTNGIAHQNGNSSDEIGMSPIAVAVAEKLAEPVFVQTRCKLFSDDWA